jgi:hypothetical protein
MILIEYPPQVGGLSLGSYCHLVLHITRQTNGGTAGIIHELHTPINHAITDSIGGTVTAVQKRTGEKQSGHYQNLLDHPMPP